MSEVRRRRFVPGPDGEVHEVPHPDEATRGERDRLADEERERLIAERHRRAGIVSVKPFSGTS